MDLMLNDRLIDLKLSKDKTINRKSKGRDVLIILHCADEIVVIMDVLIELHNEE